MDKIGLIYPYTAVASINETCCSATAANKSGWPWEAILIYSEQPAQRVDCRGCPVPGCRMFIVPD
jgi:hypothetical protein